MSYTIQNGDMSGNIDGTIIDLRGKRFVLVRAEWAATGSPIGVIGLRVGCEPTRLTDIGNPATSLGLIPVQGAQPNVTAGYIMFELQNGAHWGQGFYTRTGGGAANASLIMEISGN